MKEFKIKYHHNKAKEILETIKARFKGKTQLEDFYLKSDQKNIWKISKENGKMYLVNLIKRKNGFDINISKRLDKEATSDLMRYFENNSLVMKKIREHYFWKEAEIVLDNIIGLGEFIELYPQNELSKKGLFNIFCIKPSDLITKSYYDIWKRK